MGRALRHAAFALALLTASLLTVEVEVGEMERARRARRRRRAGRGADGRRGRGSMASVEKQSV
jgi:hypothetical protein